MDTGLTSCWWGSQCAHMALARATRVKVVCVKHTLPVGGFMSVCLTAGTFPGYTCPVHLWGDWGAKVGRRPGLWAHGKRLRNGYYSCPYSFWKRRHCFPFHTLPYPSPPLTRVMSSGGTSTPAFEAACFSEHILNFVLCLVWVWLLCLSLCWGGWQLLVRLLPQLNITEYGRNKLTLNPKWRKPLKEESIFPMERAFSSQPGLTKATMCTWRSWKNLQTAGII